MYYREGMASFLGTHTCIITTNLGFDRRTEIFGNEALTAAMVDRLTHKAIIVNMNGQSLRVKESQKLALKYFFYDIS